MNPEFKNLQPYMESLLEQAELPVSNAKKKLFMQYLSLLKKWNQAFNLTAIRDDKKMISHHLMDSLSVQSYLIGQSVLDVGSGAGLPGIILAIYDPTKQFTLLDSVGKKTRFIRQVVSELALPNVEVVQERVENYRNGQGFDVIMARAVGSIPLLLKETEHLIHPQSIYLFMKGDYPDSELVNLEGDFEVIKLIVPGVPASRHLVIVKKRVE